MYDTSTCTLVLYSNRYNYPRCPFIKCNTESALPFSLGCKKVGHCSIPPPPPQKKKSWTTGADIEIFVTVRRFFFFCSTRLCNVHCHSCIQKQEILTLQIYNTLLFAQRSTPYMMQNAQLDSPPPPQAYWRQ